MSQNQPLPLPNSLAQLSLLCFALIATATAGGCNSFGNGRLVKELQSENERLLAEYRAQRDRAEQLEKTNRQQADRLAESEKLLARLAQTGESGRLSSLPTAVQPRVASPGPTGSSQADGNSRSSRTRSVGPTAIGQGRDDPAAGLRWLPRMGNP